MDVAHKRKEKRTISTPTHLQHTHTHTPNSYAYMTMHLVRKDIQVAPEDFQVERNKEFKIENKQMKAIKICKIGTKSITYSQHKKGSKDD